MSENTPTIADTSVLSLRSEATSRLRSVVTRCDRRSISAPMARDCWRIWSRISASARPDSSSSFTWRFSRERRISLISADSALSSSVRLVRSALSRSPSVWASRLALASRSARRLSKSERITACSRMRRSSSPCRRDSTARICPPKRMSLTLSRLSGATSLGGAGGRSAGRAAGAGGASFRPFSGRWLSVLAMLGTLDVRGDEIGASTGQATGSYAKRPAARSRWPLAAAGLVAECCGLLPLAAGCCYLPPVCHPERGLSLYRDNRDPSPVGSG